MVEENKIKDTKIDTLITNFKILQEDHNLKDTKIDALEENVKILKEENNFKDKTLTFLMEQDRIKGKKIKMLENVFENKHKESANINHDSTDTSHSHTQSGNSSDTDQNYSKTRPGDFSNADQKNHHFEDDGQKQVVIRRSIHKSTVPVIP